MIFELRDGWLFYGLDGVLMVARYTEHWGWEAFEARIEWWSGVYRETEPEDQGERFLGGAR